MVEWDSALVVMNEWYDQLVAAARMPTFPEREEAIDELDGRLKETAQAEAADIFQVFGGRCGRSRRDGEKVGEFCRRADDVPSCV